MRRFAFLAGAVLFVVLAWTGAWFLLAFTARNEIVSLASADGETSPKLSCGRLDVSGFPFRWDFSCETLAATYQDTAVTLPALHVAVPVMWPLRALLSARGDITVADAFTGSRSTIGYESLTASARLEGFRIGRVSLVADKISWRNANFGDAVEAAADHLEAHAVDMPERHLPARGAAALALYLKADGVEVPGLTLTGGTATLDAELSGVPDDLRRLDADPLRTWQAAGGTLVVNSLKLAEGERSLDARSSLALDDAGRVEGRVELSSRGVVETAGQMLPEQFRRVILGSQNQDGSYSQTLNAKAGIVLAGFLPVSVIPPLF